MVDTEEIKLQMTVRDSAEYQRQQFQNDRQRFVASDLQQGRIDSLKRIASATKVKKQDIPIFAGAAAANMHESILDGNDSQLMIKIESRMAMKSNERAQNQLLNSDHTG